MKMLIQGESSQVEELEGGDRGAGDKQKIIWEGGSKMQPWGDIRKILVFWQILQKKFAKMRVAF